MTDRVSESGTATEEQPVLSDDDSDCDEPMPKKPKSAGFNYKTKYSKEWEAKFPFISSVPHKPHCFRCNICMKELGCGYQGISDVKQHIQTKFHQKQANGASTQSKLSFTPKVDSLGDKV